MIREHENEADIMSWTAERCSVSAARDYIGFAGVEIPLHGVMQTMVMNDWESTSIPI